MQEENIKEEVIENVEEILEDEFEEENETKNNSKNAKKLTSAELYKIILKNPTYRVCESINKKDAMRPLSFKEVNDAGQLVFEYDFAATMHTKHALCEDIIDLIGPGDEIGNAPVYCDDFLIIDWENQTWYKKATVVHDCYWILLHR